MNNATIHACILFLGHACANTPVFAQGHFFPQRDPSRPSRHERRALEVERREAYKNDTAKWDRMPRWSAGALLTSGYDATRSMDPALDEMESKDKAVSWRGEGSYRLRKGWYVMSALEQSTQLHGGVDSARVIAEWSDGWFDHHTLWEGDLVGVQHGITSLSFSTGLYSTPFPRVHKVGMTVAGALGLNLHYVVASYRVAADRTFVEEYGLDLYGGEDPKFGQETLDRWKDLDEFAKRRGFGVSAQMVLRTEVWVTKHISWIMLDMTIDIPLLKPRLGEAHDAASGVTVKEHQLDLTSATLGTGLAVHF